ncbi:MAG: hypothetical protein A3F72_17395 [Bacteroidetes bacterium RIFCSPLOWO2_12_FULL_35_15]|nr:MAG: hypothetical protein A3F72_17395 [Bacteroidetes bacterium RIFCSPLOWO2_12_FULL_35_15]
MDNKRLKISLLFFASVLFLFSGCSWQEYFVVSNESTSDITLEYEIESPENGFPIFESHPSVYQLDASGTINWNEKLAVADGNMLPQIIQLVLPPKSAIIIGNLSNDHYEKQDQYFINGRKFNLKNMKIVTKNKIIEISPENFDTYFKKKNGFIIFKTK